MAHSGTHTRIAWVDIAKGWCIILVVMMHSTLGVEAAAGSESWMHAAVAFAEPFRMPDFFLISGLFLAARIDRPWLSYLDTKVFHFAYLYVLWLTIQLAIKAPGIAAADGPDAALSTYLISFINPFGALWFIYVLPVFFVIAKLIRRVPSWLVIAAAALLEIAPIHTGWMVADEFCSRFVYFYVGYVFADRFFALADAARAKPALGIGLLGLWALANGTAVATGIAELPVFSLVFGFAGAAATVAFAALLAGTVSGRALSFVGVRSIAVYLAFFLPMAATRIALLEFEIIPDVGTIALIVTIVAVVGPLVLHAIAMRSAHLRYLFERPAWAKPRVKRSDVLVPAE